MGFEDLLYRHRSKKGLEKELEYLKGKERQRIAREKAKARRKALTEQVFALRKRQSSAYKAYDYGIQFLLHGKKVGSGIGKGLYSYGKHLENQERIVERARKRRQQGIVF